MPDAATMPDAAAPPAAALPAPPPAATPPGPTGPATMAPNKMAMRLRGMVMANLGLDALDKALGLLGSQSEEGQAILKAITPLSKMFSASRSQDLNQAELKLMGARQGPMGGPQMGGGPPGFAGPARNRLAALGMMGGGAPPPGGGA